MKTSRRHAAAARHHRIESLYASYRIPVRRHLARIVGDGEAEDLAQVVFAKAAAGLGDFRGEAGIATWLFRIATRTAFDHLRSRRHHEAQRTESLSKTITDQIPEASTEEAGARGGHPARINVDREEMGQCVREYVARLPGPYSEILALSEFEGLTNAELARKLGLSLGAAKIRLHRARAALKEKIEAGCELYRTPENTLACDRKHPCGCNS